MKLVWILNTAVAVVATLVCVSYLYYACRPVPRGRLLLFSLLVIGVTAIRRHFIIRNRRTLLPPFAFIAGLGLLAAVASILPMAGMNFRDRKTATFPDVLYPPEGL